MGDQQAWLRANTFQCALGRVSPVQCRELRRRPTPGEHACFEPGGAWGWYGRVKPIYLRPGACIECAEAETLIAQFEAGRESAPAPGIESPKKGDEMGKTKAKCLECGEHRLIQGRGLCSGCYQRQLRRERGEIVRDRTKKAEREVRHAAVEPKRAPDPAEAQSDLVVAVDFSAAPEVLKALRDDAAREFRTVSFQILWTLSRAAARQALNGEAGS